MYYSRQLLGVALSALGLGSSCGKEKSPGPDSSDDDSAADTSATEDGATDDTPATEDGTTTSGNDAVECELRLTEGECTDTSIPAPEDGTKTDGCIWAPDLLTVSSGMACETAVAEARCLARDISSMPGCVAAPCSTTGVLYRVVGDEVELLPWDECGGNPKDFRDCQWVNDVATIPECDCACG